MRRWIELLVVALACATSVSAQEVPSDAGSLLRWHLALETAPETSEDAAWRAYVYVQAGAEGEVRAAAAQLQTLSPDNPDAERFLLEADCWSPTTRARGVRRADAWLSAHAADADPSSVARVQALQDFLVVETARADRAHDADVASGWLPLLASAAFAAMAFGTWRLLLRE